jgi:hypothetical protein
MTACSKLFCHSDRSSTCCSCQINLWHGWQINSLYIIQLLSIITSIKHWTTSMKQTYELCVQSLINPELHVSNAAVFYLLRQAGILLDKEANKNVKFSWKRNRMKSALDFNIHLKNSLDVFYRKLGSSVSSWLCFWKGTSICECEHFMAVQGICT